MNLQPEDRPQRIPKDPRFLLADKIPDLERVWPWNRKTIHEFIDLGLFPKGWKPTPGAHEVWTKRVVDAYLEMIGAEALAALPGIAANIRSLSKSKAA